MEPNDCNQIGTPSKFDFKSSAIFVILEYLPRRTVMTIMQSLCREMYHTKVPRFLCWSFVVLVPKNTTKEFIDILRNIYSSTHQYLGNIDFTMKGLEGVLQGEFLKENNLPDGRCRFMTTDKNISILCYFKNGKKQKGP